MIPAKCDKNKYKRGIISQIDIVGERERMREREIERSYLYEPTLNKLSISLSLIAIESTQNQCGDMSSEQSKIHSQHPHRFSILISSGLPI